jgi:D-galactarolactone cycloisomerase
VPRQNENQVHHVPHSSQPTRPYIHPKRNPPNVTRTAYESRQTDTGIVGWGEGGQYGPPEPVAAVIDHVFAKRLIGRDPTEPVVIWKELYAFSRDFGQKGTYIEAISAIDIALWDISGKAAQLPIYKLLGGAFRK